MKKIFMTAMGIAILSGAAAYGAPARPTPITLIQPDGTEILVRQIGDEHSLILVDHETGVPIKEIDGTYFYLQVDTQGKVSSTGIKVRPKARLTASELTAIKAYGSPERVMAYLEAQPKECIYPAPPMKSFSPTQGQASDLAIPSTGTVHVPVILVEYSDLPFTKGTREDFENQLNGRGVSAKPYAKTGSVADYYVEQSRGKFVPVFDIYGPITLEGKHADYYTTNFDGKHWASACAQLAEACALADSEIDFNEYDIDGDGFVDHVCFIYAGPPQDNTYKYNGTTFKGAIWPHNYDIKYGKKYFDAEKMTVEDGTLTLGHYMCLPEISTLKTIGAVGTFIHEFGHTVGLPDLYTTSTKYTEYYDPTSSTYFYYTPTYHDAMDQGCYNNKDNNVPSFSTYQKQALGWIEPYEITEPGLYIFDPVSDGGIGAMIRNPQSADDFYTFEYRDDTRWDEYFYNTRKPATGLLSYHIRYSGYDATTAVNNSDKNQHVQLIRADNSRDVSSNNYAIDLALDYFGSVVEGCPVVDSFSKETWPALMFGNTSQNQEYDPLYPSRPAATFADGTEIYITDIRHTDDGRMAITVNGDTSNVVEIGRIPLDYTAWDEELAGVQGVESFESNSTIEYYNLQGVRVANPAKGVYIKRQGIKTEKIII